MNQTQETSSKNYPKRIEEFTEAQIRDYLSQFPTSPRANDLRLQLLSRLSYKEVLAMLKEHNPPISKEMLEERKRMLEEAAQPKPVPNNIKVVEKKDEGGGSNGTNKGGSTSGGAENPDNKIFVFFGKVLLTVLIIGVLIGIVLLLDGLGIKISGFVHTLFIGFGLCAVGPILRSIWK